jgi:ribokinase
LKKIVVFGSINIDLVIAVEQFSKPGETVLGKQHQWFPGGKGANQAVVIRRLGGVVAMVGKIGNDYLGEAALKTLQTEGVSTTYIKTVPDAATGLAIVQVDAQGQNTIVVSPGVNYRWDETDAELEQLLSECDLAVFQLEIPVATVGKLIKLAKRKGIFTVLNAAPANLEIIPFLTDVDLLIINETETALLGSEAIIDAENFQTAADRLLQYGCKDLIITLGESGCLVCTQGQSRLIPAYRVAVVDSTAAGDTFVGAVTTRLSTGDSLWEAARWAVAASALTVTRLGAQASIPAKNEVEEFIKTAM